MSPNDPELFLVPDISEAIHRIDHDPDLSSHDRLERRRVVEAEYATKSEKLHIIHKLLQAHVLYEKEVDYLVQDGQVLIVDEFTGRIMVRFSASSRSSIVLNRTRYGPGSKSCGGIITRRPMAPLWWSRNTLRSWRQNGNSNNVAASAQSIFL